MAVCVLSSPALYLFIRHYNGVAYWVLLAPLPLLVTRLRFFAAGAALSVLFATMLSVAFPEPVDPFKFTTLPLWVDRLMIGGASS